MRTTFIAQLLAVALLVLLPFQIVRSGSIQPLTSGSGSGGGSPGAPGHGSTTTSASFTIAAVSSSQSIAVVDGTAFPTLSYIIVSDGTHVIVGQITAGGGGTPLTVTTTAILAGSAGQTMASAATVSFSGPQGTAGTAGAAGHGSTTTTGTFTIAAVSSTQSVAVTDGTAFPTLTYVIISDGTRVIVGQVTAGGGTSTLTVTTTAILAGSAGQTMSTAAAVSFSGPQGATGAAGSNGSNGTNGTNGHGSTTTTGTFTVAAASSTQTVAVSDGVAFPTLAYCIITDGTHVIIGQVTAGGGTSSLTVTTTQILLGSAGNTMASSAAVSFAGSVGATGAPGTGGGGNTTTTSSFTIPALIGNSVSVAVTSGAGIGNLSGILITDGTNVITGQVNSGGGTATLSVKLLSLVAGSLSATMASAAIVQTGPIENISAGTNGRIFQFQSGIGTWTATTGTGTPVLATSPTLATPTFNFGSDARGDIVVRGVSANGRLAVGAANSVVISNGTDPGYSLFSGLFTAGNRTAISGSNPLTFDNSSAYAKPNVIVNGDSQVWLYGTTPGGTASIALSGTADTYYSDRWIGNVGTTGTGAATVAQTAFPPGQTAVPSNPSYFTDWNQTAAGSTSVYDSQKVPDVNTFANSTATVSVYLAATTGSISVTPQITQNFGTGGSPSTAVVTTAGSAWTVNSSTFSRFTFSFSVPSITGKTLGTTARTSYLQLQFLFPTGATFHIQIADVQFEQGADVTLYQRRPYADELIDCQFRHQRIAFDTANSTFGNGTCSSTTAAATPIFFLRQMASVPTVTFSAASTFRIFQVGIVGAATAISAVAATTHGVIASTTVTAGQIAGSAVNLQDNGSASYIDVSAEL